ncbi:MAG: hypothetical protein WCO00_10450 [Rhodospirillaceae bacterium]
MASPGTSTISANGVLSSYTFATAKQASAVQSAIDTANNSTSHKDAIKALNTLTGATTSSSAVAANKAVSTLNGGNPSSSQIAANKALVTMSALVLATDATQKLILSSKAATAYRTTYGSGSTGTGLNFVT